MKPIDAPITFCAIGTDWQIDLLEDVGGRHEDIERNIHSLIERYDKTYSRFRPDSLISKIAQAPGEHVLPHNARALMKLYRELYDLTHGAFTPFIGQMLSDAGYDATYSLMQKRPLQQPPQWDNVINFDAKTLHLKTTEAFLLDFGAGGKGHLIDLVGALLKQKHHIHNYTIDAGGDILHHGIAADKKPLRIGLEHPQDTTKIISMYELGGGAICASAGNKRAWKDYHHIMNPHTKQSVTSILATWVVAREALVADAIATCLFFAPAEKLSKAYEFEYAVLKEDYTLERSNGFNATLYI